MVPIFQQASIDVLHVVAGCKLRPGSSTDSAIDQCARRVGRIQNNGKPVLLYQAAVLHVAMIGHASLV
jgi:hypothetical protein